MRTINMLARGEGPGYEVCAPNDGEFVLVSADLVGVDAQPERADFHSYRACVLQALKLVLAQLHAVAGDDKAYVETLQQSVESILKRMQVIESTGSITAMRDLADDACIFEKDQMCILIGRVLLNYMRNGDFESLFEAKLATVDIRQVEIEKMRNGLGYKIKLELAAVGIPRAETTATVHEYQGVQTCLCQVEAGLPRDFSHFSYQKRGMKASTSMSSLSSAQSKHVKFHASSVEESSAPKVYPTTPIQTMIPVPPQRRKPR